MNYLTADFIKKNILSSRIYKFSIYDDTTGNLSIDIFLELQYPKGKYLKITFINVKKYTFSWSEEYYFYYIERYKYFRLNSLYYVSFDPDNEEDIISEKDSDFILCSKIDVFIGDSRLDL